MSIQDSTSAEQTGAFHGMEHLAEAAQVNAQASETLSIAIQDLIQGPLFPAKHSATTTKACPLAILIRAHELQLNNLLHLLRLKQHLVVVRLQQQGRPGEAAEVQRQEGEFRRQEKSLINRKDALLDNLVRMEESNRHLHTTTIPLDGGASHSAGLRPTATSLTRQFNSLLPVVTPSLPTLPLAQLHYNPTGYPARPVNYSQTSGAGLPATTALSFPGTNYDLPTYAPRTPVLPLTSGLAATNAPSPYGRYSTTTDATPYAYNYGYGKVASAANYQYGFPAYHDGSATATPTGSAYDTALAAITVAHNQQHAVAPLPELPPGQHVPELSVPKGGVAAAAQAAKFGFPGKSSNTGGVLPGAGPEANGHSA